MKIEQVLPFIDDGKFFAITFTKRTTGEERMMIARRGVAKDIKGTGKPFHDADKGLITVWDVAKKAYRSIATESISRIAAGGKEILISE